MHPALHTGRNEVEFELVPGHTHRATWLDPELPATFALVEEVMAGTADLFPSPYLHIGGDEPHGMPHDLYTSYVGWLRDLVRSLGKRPLGWQESARAGVGPDDVIQYWFADIPVPPNLPPEVQTRLDADLALSRSDVEAAITAAAPVIVSPLGHCYLDVPYAEPTADPAQAERQRRLGLRLYPRTTVAETFDWNPEGTLGPDRARLVAGVEAAIWAETIRDADDLTFLLLPRLPGIAQKAWGDPATPWTDHRTRLAHHGRLWDQDGLTYFRSSAIDWE
jgi:hexosaminidase